MLVESAIKNICDGGGDIDSNTIDWLDLTWLECRRRFAQKQTRAGRAVRILLRLREVLKHGDVVGHWPDGTAVVVNLLPSDVLQIQCNAPADWVSAAFQIGNLHLPIQITADSLLVPTGGEGEAMLVKYGIAFEQKSVRFQPTHWPDMVQLSDNFRVIQS